MKQMLGPDWRNLFDLNLVKCQKPLFQRAQNPFFVIDPEQDNLKGVKISTPT
jgi:hypothetical protein